MEQQWITDRLPTEADGDADGDVRLRRWPGSIEYSFAHWSHIGLGVPWRHTSYWKPPTEHTSTEHTSTEPDRIAALEQRVAELGQLFWAHKHEAQPVSIPAEAQP
jgi:hypothetical protein